LHNSNAISNICAVSDILHRVNSRLRRIAPLLALFALALIVRVLGLSWGLPTAERWYSYHPDERQTVVAVASLDFFNGDFNPNFFNYPSLFLYFAYLAHTIAAGFGLGSNITNATAMWQLPHDILLSARWVSALLGAATVPLTYLIAREWQGWRLGVVAALLVCFAPGHVQHSHFATVDIAATFWVTLSLWLATRALRHENSDSGKAKMLLWSGVCAGLAAATKYNGVIILIAPLAAALAIEYSNKPKLAIGVLLAAIGGFLTGCPYSVLNFAEFWGDGKNNGFAYELLVHPRQGSGDIFVDTGNGWWYHATFNLPFVLTAPLAV
jgi:4-amino-4-deoxy-L-arabinose transferase-like glycosyltransferase